MSCYVARVRCWGIPEIVAFSTESVYLRSEVWVVLFSVALGYVFFVCLSNDGVELGNRVVNVGDG